MRMLTNKLAHLLSMLIFFCALSTVVAAQSEASEMLLIDVRTEAEFKTDGIASALHIPFQEIGQRIQQYTQGNKDAEIKLYCRSGRRASIALQTLVAMGYTNVENLRTVANTTAYLNQK